MKTIGNILWFLFGGLIGGLSWVLAGCLWCITIVGIPVGLQCFKFASLAFFPFGKEVVYGGGGFSLLVNILWSPEWRWPWAMSFWDACGASPLSGSLWASSASKWPVWP